MIANAKQMITKKAAEIGIDKIGFGAADPFTHLEESLREQKEKNHVSGFEHPIIEERIYPELIFENPKSFLSIALAYPTVMQTPPKREKGVRRGYFARASWGVDYHKILNEKLDQLIEYMQDEFGSNFHYRSMVDTGALIDVAVAHRCGMGFIGKNGLLITGIWFLCIFR